MRAIALVACLLLPGAASAGQLRPATYAAAWCAARAEGASMGAAIAFAVEVSYDPGSPTLPQYGGSSLDAREAVRRAYALCPQYIPRPARSIST
jgi:hypothetical protein